MISYAPIASQYLVDPVGEIFNIDDYSIDEKELQPTADEVLLEIIEGSENPSKSFWIEAQEKYCFLRLGHDQDSVMMWKLITDMSYLTELLMILEVKPDDKHWVDIYRESYNRLNRIIDTYKNNDLYEPLGDLFDVVTIATEIKSDLLLNQTRPIAEAEHNPEKDYYTGIENDLIEPINVPEVMEFKDKDGNIHIVSFKDQKYAFVDDSGNIIEQDLVDDSPTEQMFWSGNLDDTDHDWYEDGEITSAPIRQMIEQEYKVTDEYYELLNKYAPIILEFNRHISEIKEKNQRKINRIKGILSYIDDDDFKDLVNEKSIKPLKQEPMVEQYQPLVKAFVRSLREELKSGVPIQDISALVMTLPFEVSIDGNVDTIIDQFGDDILDSIVEAGGIYDTDESVWEHDIESLHKQTLKLMEKVANQNAPKLSAIFTTEVFRAIVEDQLPVSKATSQAYDAFRALSPAGSNAYRQSIEAGDSQSEAMKNFYKVASEKGEFTPRDRFLSANDKTVTILTASSSFTEKRKLSWKLLRYKARQNEVYVDKSAPESSKKWLFNQLKSRGWTNELIRNLSE
jgi:hypothetical protein